MTKQAKAQAKPEGYHTLTPYLTVHDGAAALRFYREAFGAEELFRMDGPDGTIGHAEMTIGDSPFMLADEMEVDLELVLLVDVSRSMTLEAGAKEVMPVKDQFYGDRSGSVEDPFGHRWTIATHVEDVPPDELQRRAKEAMAQM